MTRNHSFYWPAEIWTFASSIFLFCLGGKFFLRLRLLGYPDPYHYMMIQMFRNSIFVRYPWEQHFKLYLKQSFLSCFRCLSHRTQQHPNLGLQPLQMPVWVLSTLWCATDKVLEKGENLNRYLKSFYFHIFPEYWTTSRIYGCNPGDSWILKRDNHPIFRICLIILLLESLSLAEEP